MPLRKLIPWLSRARRQPELFKRIFEQTKVGVFLTDSEGTILEVNPALLAITGFEEQELIGRSEASLRSKLTSTRTRSGLWTSLHERGCWQGELVNLRRGGGRWCSDESVSVLHDGRGGAAGYLWLTRDITKQRKARLRRLRRHVQALGATQAALALSLAKLAECRDPGNARHLERMRIFCRLLALELRNDPAVYPAISRAFLDDIGQASPLHDIGKIGIPDSILLKPGPLSRKEFDFMKRHPLIGGDTLRSAEVHVGGQSFLTMAKEIAYFHHEQFDGTGYPYGISGSRIPLPARIVALADAYDAMTSRRVYKDAIPHDESRRRIILDSGQHFDPVVVQAFLRREQEFADIRSRVGEESSAA